MIRTFRSPSVKDAMQMVKKEMGEHAVILQTRKIKAEGPADSRTPEVIEITAMAGAEGTSGSRTTPHLHSSDYLAAEIKTELKHLKETVKNISYQIDHSKSRLLPQPLRTLLQSQSVDEDVMMELFQRIPGNEFQDEKELKQTLFEIITQTLKIDHSLDVPRNQPKRIWLVGPTGVGKTTTIIKLATHPQFYGKKRTALITLDTYRVAAAAQLKIFATLANLPLQIVYEPAEFAEALDAFKDKEVILIDTAGRSPFNFEHIQTLESFMKISVPDEIHLVLSVSMRADNSLDAAKNFCHLPVNRLIFSKLDETPRLGNILNIAREISLPISFLTNGQTIPDDILFADKDFIAKTILN